MVKYEYLTAVLFDSEHISKTIKGSVFTDIPLWFMYQKQTWFFFTLMILFSSHEQLNHFCFLIGCPAAWKVDPSKRAGFYVMHLFSICRLYGGWKGVETIKGNSTIVLKIDSVIDWDIKSLRVIWCEYLVVVGIKGCSF